MKKVVLVVGIGNVGREYEGTRHNIGFDFIDTMSKYLESGVSFSKKLNAEYCSILGNDARFYLIKPTTFVNLSGMAVRAWKDFYKITNDCIYVVYDDISIPLGKMKISNSGSSGGHNGIKSITEHIGSGYVQIKIGLKPVVQLAEQNKLTPEQIIALDGKFLRKTNNIGHGEMKNEISKIGMSKFVLGRLREDERLIVNRKINVLVSNFGLLLSSSNNDKSKLMEMVSNA